MTLAARVAAAQQVIAEAVAQSPRLAFFTSFGKDSLAVMHLARPFGVRTCLTIPNHDEHFDFDFLAALVAAWELDVHVLPQGRAFFCVHRGVPSMLSLVAVSPTTVTLTPTTLPTWEEGDPRPCVCVDEELRTTRGVFPSQDFDGVLGGFKLVDLQRDAACRSLIHTLPDDVIATHIRAHRLDQPHTALSASMTLHLPLLHWTNEEVWEYLEAYQVPYSRRVYDATHAKPAPTRAWCYRCHDPAQPMVVSCPKLGQPVLNVAPKTGETAFTIERLRRLGCFSEAEAALLAAEDSC